MADRPRQPWRWLLVALLGCSCWVYRSGPYYTYEPAAPGAWTIAADRWRHSGWSCQLGPLRVQATTWHFRPDLVILEVGNTSAAPQRVQLAAATGGTAPIAAVRPAGERLPFAPLAAGTWLDVPPGQPVAIRIDLASLRDGAAIAAGQRLRCRLLTDGPAGSAELPFDFRLARIWFDYACLPVVGN